MIVGDPDRFAISSHIEKAFERTSVLALGNFNIFINGSQYGVTDQDATLLSCSLGEVSSRIHRQGTHTAVFSAEDACLIATDYRKAFFHEPLQLHYCGLSLVEFCSVMSDRSIEWAPDGDEAFDDGSYVLHFDFPDSCRLIGFKSDAAKFVRPNSLNEIWVAKEEFYSILQEWRDSFLAQWSSMKKSPEQ